MSITEQLQTNLKKYREEAHITGSELARRSGVSRAFIWQIEHGESAPTLEIVEQLARGLGITVEMLLGLNGKVPAPRLQEMESGFRIDQGWPDHLIEVTYQDNKLTLRIDSHRATLDMGESGYFLAYCATWYEQGGD